MFQFTNIVIRYYADGMIVDISFKCCSFALRLYFRFSYETICSFFVCVLLFIVPIYPLKGSINSKFKDLKSRHVSIRNKYS